MSAGRCDGLGTRSLAVTVSHTLRGDDFELVEKGPNDPRFASKKILAEIGKASEKLDGPPTKKAKK